MILIGVSASQSVDQCVIINMADSFVFNFWLPYGEGLLTILIFYNNMPTLLITPMFSVN
jgi:hypothetical protein